LFDETRKLTHMALKDLRQQPSSGWRIAAILRRADFWLWIMAVAVAAVGLWYVSEHLVGLLEYVASARNEIAGLGPLAPLLYITVFAGQILIAPLPGQFLGVMSGYLFGAFWGSLYSIIGLAVGAGVAMLIARRFGRPLLERFFEGEQIRHWERRLRMRSPVTWAMLFILPVPDFVFYIAGLSRVPLQHLMVAVIAGRSVGLIIANLIGMFSAILPPEWVLVKWFGLAAGALLVYLYQRQIRLSLLLSMRWLRRSLRRIRRSRFSPNKA
jgi:uncharacterized membrane protein YdjX (TVP38/TMEM64 family)